ncbi:MAG TPA: SET domain-containing protein-lysine N-methyltransferase [Pyrinomonadaceae bacterium]|nr:SET domain-containing protein-lysine N-methyltransferase [Pyrinomonadaceae bacterium]
MTKNLEVRKSNIFGRGCFALAHFPARRKFAEYAGELVHGRRRIEARLSKQRAIRVIWIDDDTAVDGAVGGDATAYINHSCDPNAFMRTANGDRVLFFALRDIRPGEEITMNYRDPTHPEVCRCGAPNCRSNKREKAGRQGKGRK